ncbi:hypothetical protein P43SY_000702 [Pythium insidiosum]|uniref:RNA-directed DNA polymerase n=1 Tax=Pythium insidiosum TaxID=114742 RepID=A0AAD5LQ18_PYTIN|nr:hypothetical protein P43SY_000702 [Pythium insidiosum]
MTRNNSDDDDYISYTLIVSLGIDGAPPDTSKIKMRKFYGGTAKEWIQWSIAFKSLIKKKKWSPDQAIQQLLVLIEGQFAAAVEQLYEQALASNATVTVDQFLDEIGGWFVPLDFSDSLEAELFHLTKRRDESVQQLLQRMQELESKDQGYPRISCSSESDDEIKLIDVLRRPEAKQVAPLRIHVQIVKGGPKIEALLDSGASKSIINDAMVKTNMELGRKLSASTLTFSTVNGSVESSGSMVIQFRFPELQPSVKITHRFEVVSQSQDLMVLGRDVLEALGIVLNFRTKTVQWDEFSTPLNTGRHEGTQESSEIDPETTEELKEAEINAVSPLELLPADVADATAAKFLPILTQYQQLYSGRLGRMRFDDYVLPLSPDFKPIHAKPYPIPKSMETKAKEEIQRLIQLDVLEQIYDSEMASPAFFLKKPNGTLRLLIDYRALNKHLRRSPYFVPRIREILLRLAGARCLSTFDANMGYYARRLAEHSRAYTAFCLSFGKFRYKRLPMGISTAPDEYQACMERIFGDLPFVVVYLDDLLVFSGSENEHLGHLKIVFERLEQYDVTLNGKKCHILRTSVDYLGYTLTADGIQPQEKKIQAIQKIAIPRSRKELRRFLGMINYYRDMVPNKAALCASLNRLTSTKVPFTWLPSDTDAFRAIQKAFAQAVLLAFPDFDKPFHVFADASGRQIGGIITQDSKILACFSRSLNKHQVNYTVMELELLSIVELLREYRTMLLGFEIVVHTDHKNLIYPTETSLRVKRWKLLLAEYRLTLHYIKGEANVGADAFSRMRFEQAATRNVCEELYSSTLDENICPFHGPTLRRHQEADDMIAKIKNACLAGQNNPDYKLIPFFGCTLVTHQGRVLVPNSLRADLVDWYHQNLGHAGSERQYKTMRSTFFWPGMEASITTHTVNPWDVVHVDLMGPYDDGFYAITMIDQATRWLEIGIQPDKLSKTTAECFDQFTAHEFQELLQSYAIKSKPITAKNPQANAICERVHLELMNVIRCHEDVDWKKALHYAAFAVRASYHGILNASPGQIVFGQDMISRQLYDANWSYMSKRRFEAILADNDRENDKRIAHIYRPGDNVMLRVPKQFRSKTNAIANGPFAITVVHDNGTHDEPSGTSMCPPDDAARIMANL